jgi:hypothetical protein
MINDGISQSSIINHQHMQFARPVYADAEGLFDVAGAAGAGDEGESAGRPFPILSNFLC